MFYDGRLTYGQGLTVDFLNAVFIMTSNLGSDRIQMLAEAADYDTMKSAVMDVVATHFRPEFINRIDDAVVFHALGREHIRKIVDIQLEDLRRRLAERELILDISDAALERLAAAGFDPVYGARPLKRAIQVEVENPLAERILRGDFAPGDTISIGTGQSPTGTDALVFEAALLTVCARPRRPGARCAILPPPVARRPTHGARRPCRFTSMSASTAAIRWTRCKKSPMTR